MCVVNKPFEILEFVLIPFMLTCRMMRFLRVLLFVLYVCVLRESESGGNAGVGPGEVWRR